MVMGLLLLPIVVHPSVDRVFSNYVKCTCDVRERLCRFKMYSLKHDSMVCLEGAEWQSLLEGL